MTPLSKDPGSANDPFAEFEQMLLGIATDKQIRKRLLWLEELGFIETRAPAKRGAAKAYRLRLPELQTALSRQAAEAEQTLGSNNRHPFGQMTDADNTRRLNDPTASGQITDTPSVKQPMPPSVK